ncbi:MAG: FRG domain-containing protein, partial [Acidobacteriaceae bacterium]|nr:FRG domain-containing protein [Acidobacteriaceae bacterium]
MTALQEPLFRGLGNSQWRLNTTLERSRDADANETLLTYYRKAARTKPAVESLTGRGWNDIPDWPEFERLVQDGHWIDMTLSSNSAIYEYLLYLRHHGFPSPILDWTADAAVVRCSLWEPNRFRVLHGRDLRRVRCAPIGVLHADRVSAWIIESDEHLERSQGDVLNLTAAQHAAPARIADRHREAALEVRPGDCDRLIARSRAHAGRRHLADRRAGRSGCDLRRVRRAAVRVRHADRVSARIIESDEHLERSRGDVLNLTAAQHAAPARIADRHREAALEVRPGDYDRLIARSRAHAGRRHLADRRTGRSGRDLRRVRCAPVGVLHADRVSAWIIESDEHLERSQGDVLNLTAAQHAAPARIADRHR